MSLRVGIDVGGTFTDFALHDSASGSLRIGKVLTTPTDPSVGVLAGLDAMATAAGCQVADLAQAVHATTIATNTVIQRNGPEIALLTTEGFRDVLIIGRQKRWELYDNSIDKPTPLVPRHRTWEVPERLMFDGRVHKPLDEAAVRRVAREIRDAGVDMVAICFLHAYVNAAHERRAAEIIQAEVPGMTVTLSSEVSPIYREYERASTTTINAYVMPAVAAYVRRIEQGLESRGARRALYLMQSNGGIATPEIVTKFPVRIIESGPAAGVLTAARYREAAGTENLMSFDMGGTTAKICLIEGGRPALTGQFEVDMVHLKKNSGLPMTIPAIDLVEIGAGGGSIAAVQMGTIVVGPQSAGSVPGPICYGRGGARPTVTDADLVLGYLNPDYFLGGEMRLNVEAARRGIVAGVGAALGMDAVAAAWGIHEVVTSQMAQAARVVSVGRGKDPRHFALIPFGGAGPVHGARLARMLGCPRVVFPKDAGVESAIGLLMAEPSFDLARTLIVRLEAAALPAVNALYRELEAAGAAQLDACRVDGRHRLARSADMRFAGQGYEINVPLPGSTYGADDVARLRDAFFREYATAYGDRAFDRRDAVEVVHWRLTASVAIPPLSLAPLPAGDGSAKEAAKGTRPVYFPEAGGFTDCPVYDRYALRAGDTLAGPAVIEERESTVVVLPGSRARVDAAGNIVVDLDS
ncbi:MAG: hydantoinase/oxoprolinase family protein [Alphaproteobacteria bacterium]|nr:hydantoinase/oxoprolinase family protein [Alphaproteobacteria bacterium]